MKFNYITNRQRQHEDNKLIAGVINVLQSKRRDKRYIYYRRYKEMIHIYIYLVAMMCKRTNKVDYAFAIELG